MILINLHITQVSQFFNLHENINKNQYTHYYLKPYSSDMFVEIEN